MKQTSWVAVTTVLIASTSFVGCSKSKLKLPEPKPTKLVALENSLSPLSLKWTHRLGGGDASDPLRLEIAKVNIPSTAGKKTMYFAASRKGDVIALDAQGNKVWSRDLKTDITSSVSANHNTLVVVDDNARVMALNPIDGSSIWKKQQSSAVLSPPLVTNDNVIVVANNGVVAGINTQTGQSLWNFTINVPAFSLRGTAKPIELAKNFAVIAAADGRIHAIRSNTGIPIWVRRVGLSRGKSEFDRLNDVDADPVFYDYTLYTASFQGQVVAIDMNTRRELFQIPVSSVSSVGVSPDNLYVASTQGELICYDRETGKQRWIQKTLLNRKLSNPVSLNDTTVVVGDYQGYLHVFDALSGKPVARYKTNGSINTLKLDDEELLIQTTNGTLSAWQVS